MSAVTREALLEATARAVPRAELLEVMARAHCRVNLEYDPNELGECSGIPAWKLWSEQMEPLLDAVLDPLLKPLLDAVLTALQRGWRERQMVATVMREAA